MEANKNFAKWLSCGIQISGTFGLHHVSPRLLLSTFTSQLFSPRYPLEIYSRQDFASALKTAIKRS
jgi:hypothetical protein